MMVQLRTQHLLYIASGTDEIGMGVICHCTSPINLCHFVAPRNYEGHIRKDKPRVNQNLRFVRADKPRAFVKTLGLSV